MKRTSLACLALLCFAFSVGTYEPVDSIIFCIFRFNVFASGIFFRSIFCVTLLELKLSFALEAFNKVAHLSNSFVLESLEFRITKQSSNLIFHHILIASYFKASQIASLIHKLRCYVFVYTRHAKNVPAVVHIEEYVPIKILVVFSITVCTLYHFAYIGCNFFILFRVCFDDSLNWLSAAYTIRAAATTYYNTTWHLSVILASNLIQSFL